MLQTAFKEWAVICAALAQGKQSLILRKGGIAEDGGQFQVEEPRFWLFPTYTHQQQTGIRAEAVPLLADVERAKPPPGIVRLSHWAEVTGIYHIHDELPALLIGHLHLWSDETVRKRFTYRSPGLFVLAARVYQAAQPTEFVDTPAYQGCKSWVHLEKALPTEGSTPVLSDERYTNVQRQLDLLLNPTALA
jgi:hypothetical protein